jgi:phosphatidylserine/phosphatidylglycerophosphate/cardiolipin synthase-like enzyme
MFSLFRKKQLPREDLVTSELYNENTFYKKFIADLQNCKKEIIIESPFITRYRMKLLYPIFVKLVIKGIKIYIITRNPLEHEGKYIFESEYEIRRFESICVQVLLCKGNHHRKLAIIDREFLWEGSLNILSQTNSREIMRCIKSREITSEMINFLKFNFS